MSQPPAWPISGLLKCQLGGAGGPGPRMDIPRVARVGSGLGTNPLAFLQPWRHDHRLGATVCPLPRPLPASGPPGRALMGITRRGPAIWPGREPGVAEAPDPSSPQPVPPQPAQISHHHQPLVQKGPHRILSPHNLVQGTPENRWALAPESRAQGPCILSNFAARVSSSTRSPAWAVQASSGPALSASQPGL